MLKQFISITGFVAMAVGMSLLLNILMEVQNLLLVVNRISKTHSLEIPLCLQTKYVSYFNVPCIIYSTLYNLSMVHFGTRELR